MRWVYLIIVIVFVAALVIFGIQNRQIATMSFLGLSVSAPLVVLALVVYVLGAITGGSLYALLRRSVRESRGVGSAAR
jgi:putative membrane protein